MAAVRIPFNIELNIFFFFTLRRDALFRILVTVVNRPLVPAQFTRLMDRIGFKERNVVNFTEFYTAFREPTASGYPKWMDPIQRQWQEKSQMTAAQVHLHLKERAKQKCVHAIFTAEQNILVIWRITVCIFSVYFMLIQDTWCCWFSTTV